MTQTRQKFRFVCATRLDKVAFENESLLAKSLKAYSSITPIEIKVFYNNTKSLGEVYNKAIEESKSETVILVFAHDDLLIADCFWADRVLDGLEKFDLVGLAGNRTRTPKQPSWFFKELTNQGQLIRDDVRNLSGCVGHGKNEFPVSIVPYGPPAECKLLDGVFFATGNQTLLAHNIRFEPQLRFHFYDLDFCRQFEIKGLKMGTINLFAIHASGGNFNSLEWKINYQLYLKKWLK